MTATAIGQLADVTGWIERKRDIVKMWRDLYSDGPLNDGEDIPSYMSRLSRRAAFDHVLSELDEVLHDIANLPAEFVPADPTPANDPWLPLESRYTFSHRRNTPVCYIGMGYETCKCGHVIKTGGNVAAVIAFEQHLDCVAASREARTVN